MKLDKLFEQPLEQSQVDSIVETLLSNCRSFVEQLIQLNGQRWNDRGIIRGMSIDAPYGVKSVRSDRKPRDTSVRWHDLANQFFKKKFGIDRLREICLFAHPNIEDQTSMYGDVCCVFPVGDYSIIFSPEVGDLRLSIDMDWIDSSDEPLSKQKQSIWEGLEQADFKQVDDITNVDQDYKGSELMVLIKSQQYYYISQQLMSRIYPLLVEKA